MEKLNELVPNRNLSNQKIEEIMKQKAARKSRQEKT